MILLISFCFIRHKPNGIFVFDVDIGKCGIFCQDSAEVVHEPVYGYCYNLTYTSALKHFVPDQYK